jgi:hypothetical protein
MKYSTRLIHFILFGVFYVLLLAYYVWSFTSRMSYKGDHLAASFVQNFLVQETHVTTRYPRTHKAPGPWYGLWYILPGGKED